MFNNLREFEYERDGEEALGFYLVYTLGLLAAILMLGPIMARSGALGHTPQQIRIVGDVTGRMISVLYCTGLSIMVLRRKRMRGGFGWALAALTTIAALLSGVIGMAVTAYMTTRPVGWPAPKIAERRTDVPDTDSELASPEYPEPEVGQEGDATATPDPLDEEERLIAELEKASTPSRPASNRLRPDLRDDR